MGRTTGLYLGKFAPFHKGHQHVVETALEEVDELLMLLYDTPNVIDVPAVKRVQWINQLYPSVDVIIAWGGPRQTGYTEEMKQKHEEFVINRIGDRNITHFFSSEFYGEHMSESLNAIDYRVDQDRDQVPISGTKVRNNTYENKDFVDPIVYFDLVDKIAIVGDSTLGGVRKSLANDFDTTYFDYEDNNHINDFEQISDPEMKTFVDTLRRAEISQAHSSKELYFTTPIAVRMYTLSLYYNDRVPDFIQDYAFRDASRYDEFYVLDNPRIEDVDVNKYQKIQRSVLESLGINFKIIDSKDTIEKELNN